jgi:hypothetical protein
VANALERPIQGKGKAHCPFAIALEQVISHALGRFRSDAGQATQRFSEFLKAGWSLHKQRE